MPFDQHRFTTSRLRSPIEEFWERLNVDNLLQDGGIIATATILSGGLNYAFQLVMGRALGPSEFGAFGALFALFYLLSVLGRGIRFSASRFAAGLVGMAGARSLHRGILIRAVFVGAVVAGLLALTSPLVGTFLDVDPRVVLVVAVTIPLALALAASQGSLEGHQYFLELGAYNVLHAGLKLLLAAVLVYAGFGIYGAFVGLLLAFVLTLIGVIFYLNRRLPETTRADSFEFSRAYRYSGPAVLAGFCLAVPANADVILVQHLFPSAEAGLYAATAVLGKILIFIPMAIIIALFPKVSAKSARSRDQIVGTLFDRAILIVAFIVGSGALVYWLVPELILGIFFGQSYVAAAPLLQWYGLAMVAFVLAIVVLNVELARDRLGFVYLFAGVSILEIALIGLFHGSLHQVIQIILLTNTALFAWGIFRVKSKS